MSVSQGKQPEKSSYYFSPNNPWKADRSVVLLDFKKGKPLSIGQELESTGINNAFHFFFKGPPPPNSLFLPTLTKDINFTLFC